MRKFLALFLALLMCVGILASCSKDNGGSATTLEQAKDYLYNVMKDKNGKEIPNDYDVVGKIIIENVSFDVTWTTDNANITIKASSKANMWTVDLPDTNASVIEYTLTATIKAADGSTIQVSFTPKLPAMDNTGVVTAPEAGVAYKLFLEQMNLGYTLYAMNSTQDGKNKFINTTLDPKAAADFYVEIVDGGFKIYTEIDGVKNYLHATAQAKEDGKGFTKAIGFATETDSVFTYNSDRLTYSVSINGEKFGVGTYNAFETISLSEFSYFTAEKINVAGGQFPITFMTSEYAETLTPDEKPVTNDPAADSTLTIAQAIELGNSKAKEQYTEGKYYVSGTVTEIQNATYGNLVISDGTNSILVYGTYDATGANRFDAMATKPAVGDTITVYGVIGKYNDAQIKNAWITSQSNHTCEFENGTCKTCGAVDPDSIPAHDTHTDADGNYACDVEGCPEIVAPAADSVLTIEQAIALGNAYQAGSYTAGKYSVTGTVTEIQNDTYGNLVISDGTNTILVYGTYDATGENRFDAMASKPAVGDTITVYGVIGKYNDAQIKNAWITTQANHTCEFENGTCKTCGAVDPDSIPAHDTHTDADGNYVCDAEGCPEIVAPAADSVLTIEQAIALGGVFAKDKYTTGKYSVTGTVTEIQNTTYGNLVISDGTNSILVYGTYDATGANRYDKMATKPAVGDTITVYGVIGKYNDAQLKNAWITAHTAHTCAYENGACSICGALDPDSDIKISVLEFVATNRTSMSGETAIWEANGIKLTQNKASSTNAVADYAAPVRIYKGHTAVIESTGMTKIVFEAAGEAKHIDGLQQTLAALENCTVAVDGKVFTLTFNAPVNSVTLSAAAQFRLNNIHVYY